MTLPRVATLSCLTTGPRWVDTLSPWAWRFTNTFGIRWYGLSYAAGVAVIYVHLDRWAKRGVLPIRPDAISKLLFWVLALGVVGGRLGDLLLYHFADLVHHPAILFSFRIGGLSVHGGIALVVLFVWQYAKHLRTDPWLLMDVLATSFPLALTFGRIANFINGELWGRPADIPWAVVFPHAPLINGIQVPRHPSQLYEALLEGLLLYGVMLVVFRRQRCAGQASAVACAGYGALRFIAEFWREPETGHPLYFGWMTQGQLLSCGMIFF
jgi:phosphatidylglycerol:prolipoprotein diacylglycerol transferase